MNGFVAINASDSIAPNLIEEISEINSLITDSGYDELKVY